MPTIAKPLSSKLAAHIGTIHIETIDHLDHEAERATVAIEAVIRELLGLLKTEPFQIEYKARGILDKLPKALGKSVYESLIRAGDMSANGVVKALVRGLPAEYLPLNLITQLASQGAKLKGVVSTFDKYREPAIRRESFKSRMAALIIEPIKKEALEKIVLGGSQSIVRMMQSTSRGINPRKLADILIKGISTGENRVQIAQKLRNELGATKAQAKRMARTEGARVATESNMAAFDAMGDFVIGYMIHATPNPDSRSWHKHRSGTVYHKHPIGRQKGMAQLPRPPMEAQDVNERPAGTPATAWNCLCYVSPLFEAIDNMPEIPVTAQNKIVPSASVYANWFASTTEKLKRRAVGSRRYDLVTKKYGEDVSYYHFIDPDTSVLMSLDELRIETEPDLQARLLQASGYFGNMNQQRRTAILTGAV